MHASAQNRECNQDLFLILTLCFRCTGVNPESFTTARWPYRFVALTRPDTDLRQPLESCALSIFTPGTTLLLSSFNLLQMDAQSHSHIFVYSQTNAVS